MHTKILKMSPKCKNSFYSRKRARFSSPPFIGFFCLSQVGLCAEAIVGHEPVQFSKSRLHDHLSLTVTIILKCDVQNF